MLSQCQLLPFTIRHKCTVTSSRVKQWPYLCRGLRTTNNPKHPNSHQELSIRRLHMPHSDASLTKSSHPGEGSRCSHANLHVYNRAHSLFCRPWTQQIKTATIAPIMDIKIAMIESHHWIHQRWYPSSPLSTVIPSSSFSFPYIFSLWDFYTFIGKNQKSHIRPFHCN